jgi:cyclopropane fatty-acyl-phospholipid synthase-like methyltransferase
LSDQQKHWDEKWKGLKEYLPASKFAQKVFDTIKDKGYKTLLDLGCGSGKDSVFFAEKGLDVTAVDFSEAAIGHVRKQAGSHGVVVKTLCQDLAELDVEGGFDVIYSDVGLQFFDDATTTEIFDKLHKLLNEGGMLFVRCKAISDFLYGKGEKLEDDFYLFEEKVRHFFSEGYMRQKLAGYHVVEIKMTREEHHRVGKPTVVACFVEAVAEK